MKPAILWTTTFVFGLTISAGTIWFWFVLLGLLPVLGLVAASRTKRVGLSGLLLGLGGFYLVVSTWTAVALVLVGCGALLILSQIGERTSRQSRTPSA